VHAFLAGAALALFLAAGAAAAATEPPASSHAATRPASFGHVEGASWLEARLRAPCCWTQTLDVHGSEIATELRREIRARLSAGETREAILDDMVRRHGDRILAVPRGSAVGGVALGLLGVVAAGGAGLGLLLVRWRRRSAGAPERAASAGQPRDALDDRIDRELEEL
jgi:cytochrome c-type biogenesis protein CcmH